MADVFYKSAFKSKTLITCRECISPSQTNSSTVWGMPEIDALA